VYNYSHKDAIKIITLGKKNNPLAAESSSMEVINLSKHQTDRQSAERKKTLPKQIDGAILV
jgi:hypothetical protein